MFLENVIIDSVDAQALGRFWEAALGTETLTDAPGIYETRLAIDGDAYLDLCFQAVPEPVAPSPRLHLDVAGGAAQAEVVERLLSLGAQHLDVGQGDVPWVVLADPDGNPFCVMEERPTYAGSGPLAALPLDSADPDRDASFWAWLSGWTSVADSPLRALRHPSGRGPLLELCPERAPKGPTKNRLHLDVRLEPSDDLAAITASIAERGGAQLDTDWGDLPWRSFTDPSGNEFCLLPAPA